MMWAYTIPTDMGAMTAYGVGVTVFLPELGEIQVAYQFPGGGQVCAVVHYQSGRTICRIEERHKGYPEQRARAAVEELLKRKEPTRVVHAIKHAVVINTVPRSVGVMRRPK